MANEDKKNEKGVPSPFKFNIFTGQMEEMTPEKESHVESLMKKVKVKGLSNTEIEELSKKMNAPAVIVIGFGSEFNERGNPIGEFSFNSVGVGEGMTTELLDFVSHIMKGGRGKKKVEIEVVGGAHIPSELKKRIVEDLKRKIETGQLRLDKGGIFGIDLAKNDMADATAYAMRATRDGAPLVMSKHPQRTPLWKRVVQFFKRPKLSESNLERSTFSNKTPEDIDEILDGAIAEMDKLAVQELLKKNICPVCKVNQRGMVSAHIKSKAMWERRKNMTERPYSDLIKKYSI